MMFAPGGDREYAALVQREMLNRMRVERNLGNHAAAFNYSLSLILPALRAHLAQQSDICRVIA